MEKEINEGDIEVEGEALDTEDDTTDWKAKAIELETKFKESGIKNRERTKTLKDEIALLKAPVDKEQKSDDVLLKKIDTLTLRSEKIIDKDEVELALKFRERTGMELDEVLADDIFQAKLGKLRDDKANELATSNIKGGGETSQVKFSPEYWIAKGTPPTADQVPNRKTRATIARAMMAATKSGKKFYND